MSFTTDFFDVRADREKVIQSEYRENVAKHESMVMSYSEYVEPLCFLNLFIGFADFLNLRVQLPDIYIFPADVNYEQNILAVLNDIQAESGTYFRSRQDVNRDTQECFRTGNDIPILLDGLVIRLCCPGFPVDAQSGICFNDNFPLCLAIPHDIVPV